MDKQKILLFLALAGLIPGCAPQPPLMSSQADADAEQFLPAPGMASLYVVREAGERALFGNVMPHERPIELQINGEKRGMIAENTYYLFHLIPDEYHLAVVTEVAIDSTQLEVHAEEIYFVEVFVEGKTVGEVVYPEASVWEVNPERGRRFVLGGDRGKPMGAPD